MLHALHALVDPLLHHLGADERLEHLDGRLAEAVGVAVEPAEVIARGRVALVQPKRVEEIGPRAVAEHVALGLVGLGVA